MANTQADNIAKLRVTDLLLPEEEACASVFGRKSLLHNVHKVA